MAPKKGPTEALEKLLVQDAQTADVKQAPEQAEPVAPPFIVYRSKEGLKLIKSFSDDLVCKDEIILAKIEDKNNRIESVCCSGDGELVAWCDNKVIKCVKFADQQVVFEQQNASRSNCVMISPKSTKIITYNTMTGGDNLHFWNVASQQHLLSMPFKKATQWKPVFSMNEDVCFQHINNELVLYVGGKFDKPKRISHLKVNAFSLSTAPPESGQTYQNIYAKSVKNKNHYIAIYAAGVKGQPSMVKIYKYPNLNDCITNKSFFKADHVKFSWSPSGNSLLLTCLADSDKSGKSYYGEQSLNFLSVKGESYFVKLPKEGTISHIEWFPSCDQDMFVCVYGLMPAKVSLFNHKCEVIFNFGDEGSFNAANFNPFGNLLAVYGIGNLAGQLCIWDFEKKKLITTLKVPDTTGIEWCADGKHILTCTTTPRLRVDNGFRLWHYAGSLIYELVGGSDPSQNLELYDAIWQPKPGKFKKPKIDTKGAKQPNLLSQSKLKKFQNSAAKYVPPSQRSSANPRPAYLDSATGIGAGNRKIVGLESLSLGNKKKALPKQENANKNNVKVST